MVFDYCPICSSVDPPQMVTVPQDEIKFISAQIEKKYRPLMEETIKRYVNEESEEKNDKNERKSITSEYERKWKHVQYMCQACYQKFSIIDEEYQKRSQVDIRYQSEFYRQQYGHPFTALDGKLYVRVSGKPREVIIVYDEDKMLK